MSYHVLDDGFGCRGSVRFAIGQAVTQIGLTMPLEERPARILGRANAPLVKLTAISANLLFDIFDNFLVIDWHDWGLSVVLNLERF